MGYRELLPQADVVANRLKEAGLTPDQQQAAFESFAYLLDEYADYYQNEYERVGEKEDRGAQQALFEMAEMIRSEGRYSTAVN
jgi:hypothetical protein